MQIHTTEVQMCQPEKKHFRDAFQNRNKFHQERRNQKAEEIEELEQMEQDCHATWEWTVFLCVSDKKHVYPEAQAPKKQVKEHNEVLLCNEQCTDL